MVVLIEIEQYNNLKPTVNASKFNQTISSSKALFTDIKTINYNNNILWNNLQLYWSRHDSWNTQETKKDDFEFTSLIALWWARLYLLSWHNMCLGADYVYTTKIIKMWIVKYRMLQNKFFEQILLCSHICIHFLYHNVWETVYPVYSVQGGTNILRTGANIWTAIVVE